MKVVKTTALFVVAGCLCQAVADTIRLKDGTSYEGRVLSETEETYLLEIQVTRSIKDERTIKKADVQAIEREKPDEKAFLGIKDLVPAPELLSLQEYDARLEKIYTFVKENQGSPLIEQAKVIAAELEKERDTISQGGVKLGDRLIPVAERNANKFEIDAKVVEATIRAHAAASRWVDALRKFEELEKDYQSTIAFREVLPLVKQIVARYNKDASTLLAQFDDRMEKREIGLERMPAEDRASSTKALAAQDAAVKARFESEKKAGVKWVAYHPDLKVSLEEAIRYAEQESKRLENLSIENLPDGGKAWRDAWTAFSNGGDPADGAAAIMVARSARMPDRYLKELEAKAEAASTK